MQTDQKRMRQLIATAAEWTASNPVLLEGEMGLESDSRKFKVGPGQWNDLDYWVTGGSGGSGSFLGLDDTPGSYSGAASRWPRVNAQQDALVFDVIEWGDIGDKPAEYPPSPHMHVEAQITDLNRLRWIRPYTPGSERERNDLVLDQGAGTYWTMVANKLTTGRAAPQAADDPTFTQPDVPAWVNQQHTGVVESGMQWSNPTQPIILVGYQIWVPTLSANTTYVIRTYIYSEDDQSDILYQEISETLLVENDWTTIAIQRLLIAPGTKFGILINALNSGANTIVGPFDWGREGNSNTGDPAAGNWNRRNQNNIVRIHEVDDQGVNRGPGGDGSLEGIIPGSTIQIVNQTDATESATYTTTGAATYGGGVYEFPVNFEGNGAGGEPPVGAICAITITVPVPSPTDYVEADPSEDVLGGIGILELDGVPQPGADAKSYGVRALVDAVNVHPDWDIVSWVGSGGGGGGGGEGGVTEWLGLLDTPDSYVGQAGKSVTVKQNELGLEFGEAGGGGASVTTGPTFPTSPNPGDLHYMTAAPTVGLYLYYDDGNSRQWVQTNGGGGGGGGGTTTIVEADATAGWQVWGDTLIQWGRDPGGTTNTRTVTFPQPFKEVPTVTATCEYNTANRWCHVRDITTTTVDVRAFQTDSNPSGEPIRWIAIGEAPDDLKKPKDIVGGSGLLEFHDPTGVASWRIVGNTLECWGTFANSSTAEVTVPFPKTFANPPAVTAVIANRSDANRIVVTGTRTTADFKARTWNPGTGAGNDEDFSWHAIGEWDGN